MIKVIGETRDALLCTSFDAVRSAAVDALRSLPFYTGEQETEITAGSEAGAARVLAWAICEKQAAPAVRPLRDLLAAYRDLALAVSGA